MLRRVLGAHPMPRAGYPERMDIKDLAGLAKPLEKLIETFGSGAGALFKPRHIREVAKAEADAALIRAEGDCAADAVRARAAARLLDEETRRQQNLESIGDRAAQALPPSVSEKAVDPDWAVHFVNEAKDTSREDMQELWGRVLAGEVASPGTFSKRTVSLVKLLEPADAQHFATLCSLRIDNGNPVVDWPNDFVTRLGLTFGVLSQLDAVGLVHLNAPTGFATSVSINDDGSPLLVPYFGKHISLSVAKLSTGRDNARSVPMGMVMLTNQGSELATIAQRSYSDEVFEYLSTYFAKYAPDLEISQPDT